MKRQRFHANAKRILRGFAAGGLLALTAAILVPGSAFGGGGGSSPPSCIGTGNKNACDCLNGLDRDYCESCPEPDQGLDCKFSFCKDWSTGETQCFWVYGVDCAEVTPPEWVEECELN